MIYTNRRVFTRIVIDWIQTVIHFLNLKIEIISLQSGFILAYLTTSYFAVQYRLTKIYKRFGS